MKKLLCGLMLVAALMSAGSAFAFDDLTHVTLAPNGRGDLLMFPFYLALDGGWETKLVVVNTSSTYSAVAKVVVRSFVYSKEILDFFIYLSPTDVWTGKLRFGDGTVRIFSDDDSIQVQPNVFATSDNPVNQPISASVCPGDAKEIGYVEVFENWSSNIGAKARPKFSTTSPLTSVKGAFDAWVNAPASFPGTFPRNILAGHYEIVNETFGVSGVQEATILKDYNVLAPLQIGLETRIGQFADNSLCEVEAALSKADLGLYFYDSDLKFALPVLTFPTKLVNNVGCVCGDDSQNTEALLRDSTAFFGQHSTGDDPFDGLCYRIDPSPPFLVNDLLETTSQSPLFSPAPGGAFEPIDEEVHIILKDYFFDEGWINMPMPYTTTCTPLAGVGTPPTERLSYTGAPVILTTFFFGGDGLGLMTGNWDFGRISYSEDGGETFVPFFNPSFPQNFGDDQGIEYQLIDDVDVGILN